MTSKQYRAIRKDLVALRDLIGKAYNKSNDMDSFELDDNSDIWSNVHNVKGKLWESYCAIDNEIIKLDKSINQ